MNAFLENQRRLLAHLRKAWSLAPGWERLAFGKNCPGVCTQKAPPLFRLPPTGSSVEPSISPLPDPASRLVCSKRPNLCRRMHPLRLVGASTSEPFQPSCSQCSGTGTKAGGCACPTQLCFTDVRMSQAWARGEGDGRTRGSADWQEMRCKRERSSQPVGSAYACTRKY